MAIVTASNTRKSVALINYVLTEQVNQRLERYVFKSGVGGCSPNYAERQFRDVRRSAGKDEGYVQAYHVVQSFGKVELDPDDTNDWSRAHDLGRALAQERFPGRQVLVVTQRDGETGCLHNHLVINAVETLTGKSMDSQLVNHKLFAPFHDDFLVRHGFVQTVKLKRGKERRSVLEIARRREGRYSWEADLKKRIKRALQDHSYTSLEDFMAVCKAYDVDVKRRGLKGRGISYALGERDEDTGKLKFNPCRRRRASKLGTSFTMDAIEAGIARNKKRQADARRREEEALAEAQRREREVAALDALSESEENPVVHSKMDRQAERGSGRGRFVRSEPKSVQRQNSKPSTSSPQQRDELRLRRFEKLMSKDYFADLKGGSMDEKEDGFEFEF